MELWKESKEYFESIGLEECGQYEWKTKTGWTVEYMGSKNDPNYWRIDNFSQEDGIQILFLNIETKVELERLLKAVGANEA